MQAQTQNHSVSEPDKRGGTPVRAAIVTERAPPASSSASGHKCAWTGALHRQHLQMPTTACQQGAMLNNRQQLDKACSLRKLYACVLVACVCRCRAVEDACAGSGVRPVLLIPGFQTSPLYDSSNKYDVEWPDFDAFGRKYGPSTLDLDLPMQWNGLEQAPTPVGPERSANDKLPSLDGFFGNIFEFAVRSSLDCVSVRHAAIAQ